MLGMRLCVSLYGVHMCVGYICLWVGLCVCVCAQARVWVYVYACTFRDRKSTSSTVPQELPIHLGFGDSLSFSEI